MLINVHYERLRPLREKPGAITLVQVQKNINQLPWYTIKRMVYVPDPAMQDRLDGPRSSAVWVRDNQTSGVSGPGLAQWLASTLPDPFAY